MMNESLAGFVSAFPARDKVYGVIGGPAGLAAGRFQDLTERQQVEEWSVLPGAALGAGRSAPDRAMLGASVEHLHRLGISGIAIIGGNGSMSLAKALGDVANTAGTGLAVVGVPKTVDNDLDGTDHSPGFLSAATCLLALVADLDLDHAAMTSIEAVRIIETLGRGVGWLAASAWMDGRAAPVGPHIILLPEHRFDDSQLLALIEDSLIRNGRALVVVAEGAAESVSGGVFSQAVFDRPLQSRVGESIGDLVRQGLGVTCRVEVPGLLQRCCSWAVSSLDREEARALGKFSAELLLEGASEVMTALGPIDGRPLTRRLATVELERVANRTRPLPPEWIPPLDMPSPGFLQWVEPMLRTPASPVPLMQRPFPGIVR